MKSVFIVRPFGTKSGINFDQVEEDLIRPAMAQANLTGGTTVEFIQQGNIRADMFEQLLVADLVIADISIHNANAFYELGIRHALRDKRTFLIKSKQATPGERDAKDTDVPFDLKTDRYLAYDQNQLGGAVEILAAALKLTMDAQRADSPIYQLLPALKPADPEDVLVVPLDFSEEVERVEAATNCGDLQLLAAEVDGFAQIDLDALGRFDRIYPTALPYISALHQYANTDQQREGYFHVELMSVRRSATKLKFLAGSESAMDAFISDVTPESVAQRLRELG